MMVPISFILIVSPTRIRESMPCVLIQDMRTGSMKFFHQPIFASSSEKAKNEKLKKKNWEC